MSLLNVSVTEFTNLLSSKTSVPGGGGASALVSSIGIALGNMVGEFTVGKKTYADVEEDIKIGRIHNLANAIGNSVAEINKTGKIQITYDPAKANIVFSPIYAKGYHPTISGGEGKVITEQQDIAGFYRDVYTIETDNIPSALKYNVRRIRDTRVYDFEFLAK